ncbi:MAG: hypothetical protein Q8R02_02630 [Hyphomonadaceae bacterium]|nr:hypothetical protein [Hyphomonadaceae bacterium]
MIEKKPKGEPQGPPKLGDPGEHPLSVLLFSWMRSTLFFRILMALLAALGVFLIAYEIVFLYRGHSGIENLPGFFGVFGFIAFGLAVLSGWPLGKLMRRPEDYYDTTSGEAGDDR